MIVYWPVDNSLIQLEEHTKIFASMCPDEILDYYDDYDTRDYYTTLMLGDVSGQIIEWSISSDLCIDRLY